VIGGILGGSGDPGTRCSSAGCTADAAWRVNWRNPRIHGPERVKVWLACDAHREQLGQYLATRGFPVVVTPLAEPVESVPDPA
jgi:hypothetical protein